MKNPLFQIFVLLLLFFTPLIATAQQTQDSTLYVIKTVDGNQYVGNILSREADKLTIKTRAIGNISIPWPQISSMVPVGPIETEGGTYLFDNPYSTRYFAGPSAYGLKKGEGYYQNTWVLYNTVSVGMSDNVDIGLGVVPTFLFTLGSGDSFVPFWFTTKITAPIDKDNVNIGLGGVYANILGGGNNSDGGGFLYGVSTFGSANKNVSAGIGWGYGFGGGLANSPTLSLSILQRGKPKWAFVSENYLIGAADQSLIILSGGARFLGNKLNIDFGGFTFLQIGEGQEVFPILPWLSISVPIGNKK